MPKCRKCGTETRNQKYCSHSCSASVTNLGIRRHYKQRSQCLKCGNETLSKYCSISCSSSHKKDQKRKEVLKNIENGKYVSPGQLKTLLLETQKTCQECGINPEWNGNPLSFQMDHINGDSDDNRLENLRILCPNCHTQTETWCARNKKNGKRNKYLRRYKGHKSKSETPLLHGEEQGAVP
jgi:hypothetical protein